MRVEVVSIRCDGRVIEVMASRSDGSPPVLMPISPGRAVRLAHELLTAALQMMERR